MKSARRRKTKDPCPKCYLHKFRCICHLIPRLDFKTRLCLIVHHRELKRTTNTGQLAIHSLVNSQMIVRGLKDEGTLDLTKLLSPNYRSVLFYPSDEAEELNSCFVKKSILPIQLIVPDGNWRQASKVATRHKEIANLERVKLSQVNSRTQHLRTEHFDNGMSTLEAVAYAFGVLEDLKAQQSLLSVYDAKLQQTLLGRGVKKS